MKRNLRKAIGCMWAVVMVFAANMGSVHAEAEYHCNAWEIDSTTEDCRTPICDGVHLTKFMIVQRHKSCIYLNTGYTFTIPDTYVREGGCCLK